MIKLNKALRSLVVGPASILTNFRFRAEIKKLFRGKTVAIVGSSPELIGAGLGAMIEKHDIVVRINSLNAADCPTDLGERSDVVFLGGKRDERTKSYLFDRLEPNCSTVIGVATCKDVLTPLKRISNVLIYPKNWPKEIARRVCRDINRCFLNRAGEKPPRSGFVCIATVAIFGEAKSVEIFGMSKDPVKARKTINGALFSEKVMVAEYQEEKLLRNHCDPDFEIGMLKELVQQKSHVSWRY